RRGEVRTVQVDVPLGESLQDLLERHATLQARERGAEAEVDSVSEREGLAVRAVDVERVAVREPSVVAVGRADEHEDRGALRNGLPVVLDVAGEVPAGGGGGGRARRRL